MSARRRFSGVGRRPRTRRPFRALTVALLVVTATGAHAEPGAPVPSATRAAGTPGTHLGSPSRPDYDCSKGGFCGTEGWDYGSYAGDTKESTGCGPGPDGVDLWDLSASHSPTLPDFARPYCAFLYGFASCSLPTVICEN